MNHAYAREILTDTAGCGIQDLLRARQQDLVVILSDIDNDVWNSLKDPLLSQPFVTSNLSDKYTAKRVLQQRLGLSEDAKTPLLAPGNHSTHQKMVDVTLRALPQLPESNP